MAAMPCWYYFSRPTNESCHNLCERKPPWNYRGLLGLGLTFIPKPRYTNYNMNDATTRFRADMYTATFMAHINNPMPRLYHRSEWTPPVHLINFGVRKRTENFIRRINGTFIKKKARSNMLPFQRTILASLRKHKQFIIFPADKNLGPCIIERENYIKRALNDHLLDTNTYQQYNKRDALELMERLSTSLESFISKYKNHLRKADISFLERTREIKDPFPKFYITAKVHKNPWKTRPIVSISGSQLHGLGQWVDTILQPYAQSAPSYIKSSRALKLLLMDLPPLPATARLFTADAVSMYTNISTDDALPRIRNYIERHADLATDYERMAVIEALSLIMRNNLFQFGDTYWLQTDGTAMGVSPSCSYATIYYSEHEQSLAAKYPEIIFSKRYIDDIFGIWSPTSTNDDERWHAFTQDLNYCGKLKWEASLRTKSIPFLDLLITMEDDYKISTRLYEKKENLYLYLPANSSHSPGNLKGLIFGMVFRTLHLTSTPQVQRLEIHKLYDRLVARGYQPAILKNIIQQTYNQISAGVTQPATLQLNEQKREHVFFHTYFHPNDPPSSIIQKHFRNEMLHRLNKPNLPDLKNKESVPIGIKRLIVCYHRTPNLGNLLSPRLIRDDDGPLVSSYL
jgi:hypothetical protein